MRVNDCPLFNGPGAGVRSVVGLGYAAGDILLYSGQEFPVYLHKRVGYGSEVSSGKHSKIIELSTLSPGL
ncbi:hypothetical protein CCP3SC1AL1_110001 [Gammaproteobacteria bacterium]